MRKPVAVRLLAVMALFAALAVAYALRTPAFEAPDEASHFLYIHNLVETGQLPVLEDYATVLASRSVQRHHPPLYYGLGALLTAGIDRSNLDELLRENPFASIGVVSPVNQNAWLHPPLAPLEGALGAVFVLRLFGIALGLGTLLCVYRTGRVLDGRASAGLASALFAAVLPGFVFISASVTNDTLIIFLSSACVALLAETWAARHVSMRRGLLLGLILGGAALTKLNGLALFGVVVLWALLAVARERLRWRALVFPLLAAGLLAALVAGWWYARNWALYGDPLAFAATLRIWGRGAALPEWGEAVGVWDSFWAVLGQFNVRGPDWFYRLYGPLLALAGFGLTGWLAFRRKLDRGLALWLALTVTLFIAALAAATRSINVSQGRLLYPALAAIAPLLMVGLRRKGWALAAAALAPLAGFAVAAPLLLLEPAYARAREVEALPRSSVAVGVESEGLRIDAVSIPLTPISTGDVLPMTLYLSGASQQNPYLTVRAVHSATQAVLGAVNLYPGMLPTDSTGGAGLLEIPLRLPITGAVEQPTQLQILLGWAAPETGAPLLLGAGDMVSEVLRLDGPVLLADIPSQPEAQSMAETTFGDAVRLQGYALVEAADGLCVTLSWLPRRALAPDYTLALGVFDASGQIIAQADGPAVGYPSSVWIAGVPFTETRTLDLPAGLPEGAALFIGWYDPQTGARLPAQGGTVRDNLLLLDLQG